MEPLQERTAKAIVNVFETGRVLGDYSRVTLLRGDTGHLTYGRSQTTLGSGNLSKLLNAYVAADGAAFARDLQPYLPRMAARDLTLDFDTRLHALLRAAGADPVMRRVQDAFFDSEYWVPSCRVVRGRGFSSALAHAVVYDSHVHGSWDRIADLVPAAGEQDWIPAYVAARRNWLVTHPRDDLRRTVYRMEAIRALIDSGKWELALPLTVCGVAITAESLQPDADARSATGGRVLAVTTPPMSGADVAAVQQALVRRGLLEAVQVDAIYGPITAAAVRSVQQQLALAVDGVVGPATRRALGV